MNRFNKIAELGHFFNVILGILNCALSNKYRCLKNVISSKVKIRAIYLKISASHNTHEQSMETIDVDVADAYGNIELVV